MSASGKLGQPATRPSWALTRRNAALVDVRYRDGLTSPPAAELGRERLSRAHQQQDTCKMTYQMSPISSTSGWPQNQQGAAGEEACCTRAAFMRASPRLARRR